MFRLVNKRLAVHRELQSLKQEFNQCSLPIDFVYRIVVSCVDEIMDRGLNHPFILKNPCSPNVVSAMLTLMADPDRRDLFSLKCMRIDTVAGVMLAVLKNLREAIVPMEIQEELTTAAIALSGPPSPTTPSGRSLGWSSSSQSINRINTVTSLLDHPSFPPVNRALLMELLNLSLAILNRSSFNSVRPEMLASILGPHIFTTQHATILQHTPQQAYSFGWGIALVNDIKRCSKMFYVLLGGYRREVLGPDEWEYDSTPGATGSWAGQGGMVPLSAVSSTLSLPRVQSSQWPGSMEPIGWSQSSQRSGMCSAGIEPESNLQDHRRLHRSVPQLSIMTGGGPSPGGSGSAYPRYGLPRTVSTTFSESIRAAAAQEARHWNVEPSMAGSKGPAALEHLRSSLHSSRHMYPSGGYNRSGQEPGTGYGGLGRSSCRPTSFREGSTVVQRQQELFQVRFKGDHGGQEEEDELGSVLRRRQQRWQASEPESDGLEGGLEGGLLTQKEEKRLAIERMIRECRGAGLNFAVREGEGGL